MCFSRGCKIVGTVACAVFVCSYLVYKPNGPSAFLLTPEEHDIWHEVRARTPINSLIFTDQTADKSKVGQYGAVYTRNHYGPVIARRQFYIASGLLHTALNYPKKIARIVASNDQVLRGEMPPWKVTKKDYSSYYAVVEKSYLTSVGADLVYENEKYRLYQIGSKN